MLQGNLNLLIASIQVRQRVIISKNFLNEKELLKGLEEFLNRESINYDLIETNEKTIVTKLY